MGIFSPFVEPRSRVPSPVSLQLREAQAQLLAHGGSKLTMPVPDAPWDLPPGAFDIDGQREGSSFCPSRASSLSRGSRGHTISEEQISEAFKQPAVAKKTKMEPPTCLAWWNGPPNHFKNVVSQRTFLELLESPASSDVDVRVRSYSEGDLWQDTGCFDDRKPFGTVTGTSKTSCKERSNSDFSRSSRMVEHGTFVEFVFSPRSSAASDPGDDALEQVSEGSWSQARDTALILKHLPGELLQADLVEVVDKLGFAGCYNLVFLPIDLRSELPAGWAAISATSASARDEMAVALDGFCAWGLSSLPCTVELGTQSLATMVREYREHPCNSEELPADVRPMLFRAGWPAPFPAATGVPFTATPELEPAAAPVFHVQRSPLVAASSPSSALLHVPASSGKSLRVQIPLLRDPISSQASPVLPVLEEGSEDASSSPHKTEEDFSLEGPTAALLSAKPAEISTSAPLEETAARELPEELLPKADASEAAPTGQDEDDLSAFFSSKKKKGGKKKA